MALSYTNTSVKEASENDALPATTTSRLSGSSLLSVDWPSGVNASDVTLLTSNQLRPGSPPMNLPEDPKPSTTSQSSSTRRSIFDFKGRERASATAAVPWTGASPRSLLTPQESSKENERTMARETVTYGGYSAVKQVGNSNKNTSLTATSRSKWCCKRSRRHSVEETSSLLSQSLEGRNSTPAVNGGAHHVHAQSLVLGLAFCAIWSSANLMAPNLTAMADEFGLPRQWLGSLTAAVTSVASLPVAAWVGVVAEKRRRVVVWNALLAVGAVATWITIFCGQGQFWAFLLCRWLAGACMGASVPVAFSLLGDWFSVEERNVASSGLTASMGLGILGGQVLAGTSYMNEIHWRRPFEASAAVQLVTLVACLFCVEEPLRGGREDVLQEMMKAGRNYDRRLTWDGFKTAMRSNASNRILLYQGFFSNLPWGVIFVFLNDFLSQERQFSIPDATFLVMIFGIGCAVGGILGGWLGQVVQTVHRSYLPLFMAASTAGGILPFMYMLNSRFSVAHGLVGIATAFSGGLVASLPAVNVRPCLINVNPPEMRGASLTAANLLIQLGRGIGPSCITLMTSFGLSRRSSFNITLILFWVVSALQLIMLSHSLPMDQDKMEADLALYARETMRMPSDMSEATIEDRITSFDGLAAKQTLLYVRDGIMELKEEVAEMSPFRCRTTSSSSGDEKSVSSAPGRDMENGKHPTENTPLTVLDC